MASPLDRALRTYPSLSLVGMGKNAGKTTVFNRLIHLLGDTPYLSALTSIGRDGEAIDLVTGTKKPGIYIRRGTLIATAERLLPACDISKEILAVTGVSTPLGAVVIVRALSDGNVQLAGPSMGEEMAALVGTLHGLGAQRVLVDGAISRKTTASPAVAAATILCAGASYHPDMERVVRDTAHAAALLTLPKALAGDHLRHEVAGALTEGTLLALAPKPGEEITVMDGSRVLLSPKAFAQLRHQGIPITVRQSQVLCCICINPYQVQGPGFDARRFLEAMGAAVSVPVINVREDGPWTEP